MKATTEISVSKNASQRSTQSGKPKSRQHRAAHALMRAGFACLPIEPAKPGSLATGKKPITAHGVNDATKDIQIFRQFVGSREHYNIGVATGGPKNIVVIDVDHRHGGHKSMAELLKQLGKLPKGPKCETGGGGSHLYFRLPRKKSVKNRTVAAGIDIKARGGYVLVPPSMHASGCEYEWAEGRGLLDIKIPFLPESWLAFLEGPATGTIEDAGADKTALPSKLARDVAAPNVIIEGERNSTLTSIAGGLRAKGLDPIAVAAELTRINSARCRPPLDDAEVERIARSAASWPAGESAEVSHAERVAQTLLDEVYQGGSTLRAEKDGLFYHFDKTHWQPIGATKLERQCQDLIKSKFPNARKRLGATAREAVSLIRVQSSADDDLLHFICEPPPVINCQNGELWLLPNGKVDLRPHSPKTGMRHVLLVSYDPNATCPLFDKTLMGILSLANNPQRVADIWFELVGYVIQPSRPAAVIGIAYGPGGNGKTKLVQTIAKLLCDDAVYSGEVGRLETSAFGVGGLVGKLLFIDDDVKAGTKLPDGVLKKISEGKKLTGERKHKDHFDFVNRAVPIMLCNNIPSVADLSVGLQRRLLVFKFSRSFLGKHEDTSLFPRIWATELPGILNKALKGWQSFVANGNKFSTSKDMTAAKRELLVQANPLAAFLDECCEFGSKYSMKGDDLYKRYTFWCNDSGYKFGVVKNTLTSNVKKLKPGITPKSINGYSWLSGIKLIDDLDLSKGR